MRAARQWLVARRLTLLVGLLASIPIVAASVHAVAVGWRPQGDDALIATRALDTLSTHPPLLGMPSLGATSFGADPVFHLGPLLSWLLALPARLPVPSALELTVGVVGIACVVGCVGLARRRGGAALMLAVGAAIPLMLASLPAEVPTDVWNPAAPVLPFCLLLFVCWSLACGEYRLLALAVLLASFVVQGHLTFALPVLGALAVGVLGLIRSSARPSRRALVATALVGIVCWSFPLVEQAIHRPGNLVLLARATTSDQPKLGPAAGGRALVRAVGVPPWWLRGERDSLGRVLDLSKDPAPLAFVTSVPVVLGLVALVVVGRRRRRPDVMSAALIGLVLCATLAFTASSGPEKAFVTTGYALWWASVAGMWVWLVLAWGALSLGIPAQRAARLRGRPAVMVGLGVVGLVAALTALTANRAEEPYDELRVVDTRLSQEAPRGPIAIEASATDDSALGRRAPSGHHLRAASPRARGGRPRLWAGAGRRVPGPRTAPAGGALLHRQAAAGGGGGHRADERPSASGTGAGLTGARAAAQAVDRDPAAGLRAGPHANQHPLEPEVLPRLEQHHRHVLRRDEAPQLGLGQW